MVLWIIKRFFIRVLINLAGGVYRIVGAVYNVFLILSRTNIFNEEHYKALIEKVYVILAVAMLFIVAYNFLTLIVDPDKDKGGATVKKMLKDIVISFILIVLTPTLFTFAFDVQNSILDQDTIGGLFYGSISEEAQTAINQGGFKMSAWTFRAFFEATDPNNGNDGKLQHLAEQATEDGNFHGWADDLDNAIEDGDVDYHFLGAVVAACYLVYVIISFCFDLAVRVVKLAFYQIIAPICIACRIMPKTEKVFKSWWNAVYKTFLAVFVRVFLMHMVVYLISIFIDNDMVDVVCSDAAYRCSPFSTLIAKALIILGILTFMRQAPKLIDEIFGLGEVKLGIREHLKESGAYAIGGAAYAGVTGATRNISHRIQTARSNQWAKDRNDPELSEEDKKARMKAATLKGIALGLPSGFFGGVSAGARGAKGAWSVGSLEDMKKAGEKGVVDMTNARDAREKYIAAHSKGEGFISDIGHAALGKIVDTGTDIKGWAGVGNVEELKIENNIMATINQSKDAAEDAIRAVIQKQLDKNELKLDIGRGININKELEKISNLGKIIEEVERNGTFTNKDGKTYTVSNLQELRSNKEKAIKSAILKTKENLASSQEHWEKDFSDSAKAKLGDARAAVMQNLADMRNNADIYSAKEAAIVGAEFAPNVDAHLIKYVHDGKFTVAGIEYNDASYDPRTHKFKYKDKDGNEIEQTIVPGEAIHEEFMKDYRYDDSDQIDTLHKSMKRKTSDNKIQITLHENQKPEDDKKK